MYLVANVYRLANIILRQRDKWVDRILKKASPSGDNRPILAKRHIRMRKHVS